jgi:hypothetical protein
VLSGGDLTDKDPETSAKELIDDDVKNKTIMSEMSKANISLPEVTWNENDAIFERLVIIIPYKAADTVK